MQKRIAYLRPDGGVSIVTPVINRTDPGGFTEQQAIQRAMAKCVPVDASDVEVIEVADLPPSRTFRDAWAKRPGGVGVDMPKARVIHMDRIRKARDRDLARLDIEQLRGRDVEAEKQRLRDITQSFDLSVAATPEELEALWPSGLPNHN